MVLPQHTEHTLLSMPAAELIPDDGVPVEPGFDVDLGQGFAAGANDGDLINNGSLLRLLPALPLTLCKPTHPSCLAATPLQNSVIMQAVVKQRLPSLYCVLYLPCP